MGFSQKIKIIICLLVLGLSFFSEGPLKGNYFADPDPNSNPGSEQQSSIFEFESMPNNEEPEKSPNQQNKGASVSDSEVSNQKINKIQSTEFNEILSQRSQTARHFYNESNDTYRFVSDQLVQSAGIHVETDWVTFDEYPIRFVLRLTNGTTFRLENLTEFNALWNDPLVNNSIFGIGIESFNGILGFYLDFSDSDWGHGQYLYYPRLKDGSLPQFNQPQYAIYPHLFVKAGETWYDKLINNRSFYGGSNDPRDYLSFFQNGVETGLQFRTDIVTIDGFDWNFTQGLKYNSSDQQFHLITELVSLDRGWDDVGFAYDITVSPQAEGSAYEPDRFLLSNESHSKLVNISTLWKANESLTNPLNSIEIISENNETFQFDFEDMKSAGFNKTYLELHNQILPNDVGKKTLLAGMFNYGSYTQGTLIEIDPTFAEKAETDAYDFYTQFDGSSSYSDNVDSDTITVGANTPNTLNGFEAWNSTIDQDIDTIVSGNMTVYVGVNVLEASEWLAIGLYDSEDTDHIWNESEATSDAETTHNQLTYWNDTTFISSGSTGINYTMDVVDLLENWTLWHNSDSSDRMMIPLKFYSGDGVDPDEVDAVVFQESTYGVTNQRPTLTFEYTLAVAGGDDPPELDAPSDQTLEAGYNNQNITWTPTERTNGTDEYFIYRNDSLVENGTWTNITAIVFDLDPYNLSLGLWNYTIFINDTVNVSATDLVWITVQDTTNPVLDSPSDVSYAFGVTGNWINWTATDYLPMNYTVYRNGTDIANGTWLSSVPINISVDGLAVGVYNYTISVNDTSNNLDSDEVIVTVTGDPVLDSPSDVAYTVDDTGNWINWTATDTDPANYTIYRNGSDIENGTWTSGVPINVSVDGLAIGVYNYTILVNDTSNNQASDLVYVTVSSSIETSTGYFVIPSNRDYYPETVLTLRMANLTEDDYYGILIGANQVTADQQWNNFTATSASMNRSIIHFNTQTYLDNQSQDIQYLLIKLYYVINDSNTNIAQLSLITYDLVRISDQLNPYVLGMLLVVGVSSLVIINIIFVFLKKFW